MLPYSSRFGSLPWTRKCVLLDLESFLEARDTFSSQIRWASSFSIHNCETVCIKWPIVIKMCEFFQYCSIQQHWLVTLSTWACRLAVYWEPFHIGVQYVKYKSQTSAYIVSKIRKRFPNSKRVLTTAVVVRDVLYSNLWGPSNSCRRRYRYISTFVDVWSY